MTFSCGRSSMKTNEIEFYDLNQNQFTFLVFDKSKVDTFISRYEPLNVSNTVIKQDIFSLSKINFDNSISKDYSSFAKNSKLLDSSDFNLAMNVIKATYDKSGEEYFHGSLNYLFFYKCLPVGFQNKWTQTISGDFRFNATFFAILRDKSEIIDKMIYGEIGHWDNKLKPIFGEHIFNEITLDKAKQIKELIVKDKSFDDVKFKTDRDNFIYFLDKTISGEWRLILTDWN
ncbi:hypothetical protein [Chondrinema litorale]|uniref:hypothetical protein n=1 Tax=Chondrinema litorale TaxID=2994555 RepID=UPI00254319EB|nr:hypothetical protein [Chondrinema litorale]UZR96777.1 hypothetical protein OQ292_24055 [Chondrinema litorale]